MGRVLVAGSINMDVVVQATRYPKLGETVSGTDLFFAPGGKGANQAVASARLGASTTLVGKIGRDAFGAQLRDFLTAQNVNLAYMRETPDAPTGTALITLTGSDNAIVVVPGANALLSEADVTEPALLPGDILVSQFEISLPTVHAFFARSRSSDVRTILNPAPMNDFDRTLLSLVDILVLNESELGALANADLDENDSVLDFVEVARSLTLSKRQTICVTLGKRGAVALLDGETITMPSLAVRVVDTTGAGDCFVGAVAAQLTHGASIRDALEYANVAASICVQRMGAGPSMPTEAEVAAAMRMKA